MKRERALPDISNLRMKDILEEIMKIRFQQLKVTYLSQKEPISSILLDILGMSANAYYFIQKHRYLTK